MLYHFSEEPNIEIFKPRKSSVYPDMPPIVWAIDDKHSVSYFFPRDCPRVIFSKSSRVKQEDVNRFFAHTTAEKIIAVENRWLERIKVTKLFVYTFADEGFELKDESAGYYISYNEIIPQKVAPVGDLIQRIIQTGVELRFTPNLYPLRDAVISSSIEEYSIIRFKNAMNCTLPETMANSHTIQQRS